MFQLDPAYDADLVAEDYAPYRAMWSAVLTTALADLDDKACSIVEDAKTWVRSDQVTPQSYLWICNMLGIDGERLRYICASRHGRRLLHKNNGRLRGFAAKTGTKSGDE